MASGGSGKSRDEPIGDHWRPMGDPWLAERAGAGHKASVSAYPNMSEVIRFQLMF